MDYTCDLFLLFSSRTEIWYLPKPRLSTSTRLFCWLFAAKNQEQCGGIWKNLIPLQRKRPLPQLAPLALSLTLTLIRPSLKHNLCLRLHLALVLVEDGEDYFYNSPSEDEGECVRKKGCEESESEDAWISEVESDWYS